MTALSRKGSESTAASELFHVEQLQRPDPFHVKRHQEGLR